MIKIVADKRKKQTSNKIVEGGKKIPRNQKKASGVLRDITKMLTKEKVCRLMLFIIRPKKRNQDVLHLEEGGDQREILNIHDQIIQVLS